MSVFLSDFDIFLCGAGISVSAPSNLPAVSRFLDELETELIARTGLADAIIRRGLRGDGIYSPVRFEQLISCISDFDPTLRCLDYLKVDRWRNRSPNAYHYFLAEMLVEGRTVITTNFDAMIEMALHERYGQDVDHVSGRLLKIHGSLQNVVSGCVEDEPISGLKADIFSVASMNSIDGQWGSLDQLVPMIDGRRLCVIGYSFSDSYDVSPMLKRSRPSKVTVFDFSPSKPSLVEGQTQTSFRGFDELRSHWSTAEVQISLWVGDASYWIENYLPQKDLVLPSTYEESIIPFFSVEQLCYLVGRLNLNVDAYNEANEIFSALISSEDRTLQPRAYYYFLKTLPDWSEILRIQEAHNVPIAPDDLGMQTYILLLDCAAFLGNQKRFRRLFIEFSAAARLFEGSVPGKKALYIGKALHCVGNSFLYSGRPRLAALALRRSIELRTKHGEPNDILFAEFGLIIALLHQRDLAEARKRIANLSIYALKIDDLESKICVETAEGLLHLICGECEAALDNLLEAKRLFAIGEDESQIDPETELYILCANIRLESPLVDLTDHLDQIERFVLDKDYSGFAGVVASFRTFLTNGSFPLQMDGWAQLCSSLCVNERRA